MRKSNSEERSALNTRVRFEQWAKNPQCAANTVSAVLNVPMGKVAESINLPNRKSVSPFAVVRGDLFERDLIANDAEKLRMGLIKKGALFEGSAGFKDFRLTKNKGSQKTLQAALDESAKFLKEIVSLDQDLIPTITTGLTLRLPKGTMIPDATLILDVMTIDPRQKPYLLRVGEIKIYPDRGGHTDPGNLASARAQAGVYKHALEEWIELNELQEHLLVDDTGFLVFTWPGSSWPVIREKEDLKEQANRAMRGFKQLDEVGQRVVGVDLDEYKPDEYIDWVLHSEKNYRESCWGFCDLAAQCQDLALKKQSGILLGSEVAGLLGSVTLERALELLDGDLPKSEHEDSLKFRLRAMDWEEN
jgi:hypothetical protein